MCLRIIDETRKYDRRILAAVITVLSISLAVIILLLVSCAPACPVGCECIYHEDYIEVNCINGSYNITCPEDWEKVRLFSGL